MNSLFHSVRRRPTIPPGSTPRPTGELVSMVSLCLALSMTAPSTSQPGSGGAYVLEPLAPQVHAAFGAALGSGQRFALPYDHLYIGSPLFDVGPDADVGRWRRQELLGRVASASLTTTGASGAELAGSAIVVAHTTDGDGRLLVGAPASYSPAEGVEGRVLVDDPIAGGGDITLDAPVYFLHYPWPDEFGGVIEAGDFNGDGYEDIAVSARRKTTEFANSFLLMKGEVFVYYGAPGGADLQVGQRLVHGSFAERTHCGSALAVGDFNGDGFDDLAVGCPGSPGHHLSIGMVHVRLGSSFGLEVEPVVWLAQDFGIPAHDGLQFGAALAAADFDRSIFCGAPSITCADDLAIGMPGYIPPTRADAGNVDWGGIVVAKGTTAGLVPSSDPVIMQGTLLAGETSLSANDERFGERLWAGEFDGRLGADLAVGVPLNRAGSETQGVLHLLYGGSKGLESFSGDLLSWNAATSEPGEPSDGFGTSFGHGDFDGDGEVDLAIGAPWMTAGGVPAAGKVVVLFGGEPLVSASRPRR